MSEGSTSMRGHAQSGFSITEAMLAITILATSMLGIASTSVRVGQTVNSAHIRTAAVERARAQLASLMAEPFGSLTDGSSAQDDVEMEWTVMTTARAQEITLIYRYVIRDRTRQDTIVSARLDR